MPTATENRRAGARRVNARRTPLHRRAIAQEAARKRWAKVEDRSAATKPARDAWAATLAARAALEESSGGAA